MMRCLTTSDGYDVIQNTWADKPPAQKLIAGVESGVWFDIARDSQSYELHQKKKKLRKMSVAHKPLKRPESP